MATEDAREKELKKLAPNELIERFLDAYDAWLEEGDLKRALVVPDEMRDGVGIAEKGWVPWKSLPSELTDAEINVVEKKLAGPLPPVFRAYLHGRYMLGLSVCGVKLPELASEGTLSEFEEFAFEVLPHPAARKMGLIPFAQDEEEPDCAWAFDINRRRKDRDCPVVLAHCEGPRVARTLYPSGQAMFVAFTLHLEDELTAGLDDDEEEE